MSFDLKPTHPVKQPCCGGTKVDDIVGAAARRRSASASYRSIRAAARAERAALIASVGGVDKLDYFWARQDKTRQQRDRESRAANFDRRPRFSGMIFF